MSTQPRIHIPARERQNRSSSVLRLVPSVNRTSAQRPLYDWRQQVLLVSLSLMHGFVLVNWPVTPVIALGLWWNANTISHNFIHRPFFRRVWQNRLFSFYLT